MAFPSALAPCTLYGLADRLLDATNVARYVEAEMTILTDLAQKRLHYPYELCVLMTMLSILLA